MDLTSQVVAAINAFLANASAQLLAPALSALGTLLFITPVAFRDKGVFPVGNRLCRVWPDRGSNNTSRKVVNRYTDFAAS